MKKLIDENKELQKIINKLKEEKDELKNRYTLARLCLATQSEIIDNLNETNAMLLCLSEEKGN